MADPVVAEVAGLQLSNNTFSASPPGSQLRADNGVIAQKGVFEPRRGQARAYTMPSAARIPFALTEFQGSAIAGGGTSKTDTSQVLGVGANPIADFTGGPWNPVDCDGVSTSYGRMKFGFAGSYMHFCTTTGPKTLESTAGVPRAAGLLRMPDPFVAMVSASLAPADGQWLPYGSSVAYRTLLRKPTSDGASLLSPPSGRTVVTNRLLAPIGSMTRTGGNLVTVTFVANLNQTIGLAVGDTFTIDPGEADFPAAVETVASVVNNVITYNDVGANVSNTVAQDFDTGPRPVGVAAFLSGDATTSTPVRIYRSKYTSSSSTEPGDEMFLVGEQLPTAGEITAGFLGFDDTTPQSVINDPLYTNPQTGQGSTQANFRPPVYRDTANWGERQWYANTTGLQQFRLQMLGVGSPDGIQNNDTITIDGDVFTFKTAATATPGEVQIFSDGTPSFNIQRTTQALIVEILQVFGAGTPIRAYYNSSQDEAPGKILLEATSYSQGAFAVRASRPASWTPALAAASDTNSQAERAPNGLAYSKLGEAEAVPAVNYTAIGSKNYAIARILGLRDALLVFKEGDGIYSVTGSAPFQVFQISTANITAPDACALFADSAWVYTDQGILRVSDSGGTSVVSRPIETELNRLQALYPDETYDYSFAVPYETERRIMFFVPFSIHATSGLPVLKAYCYCNATQAWTGPLYENVFSGIVSTTANKLLLGVYDYTWATSRVTIERKGQVFTDYADADFSDSITETDVGGDPLVIRLGTGTDVEAGDGILQTQWRTKVKRLRTDLGARYVEVYEDIPWAVAACTVYKHYDIAVQFQPNGNPTSRKTLTRLSWLFKPEWFANYAGKSLLLTDQIQADIEPATSFKGFGLNPFGQGPFGDPTPMVVDVNPLAASHTSAAQFFPGFSLSEVWCKFRLQGFGAQIDTASAPVGRGK